MINNYRYFRFKFTSITRKKRIFSSFLTLTVFFIIVSSFSSDVIYTNILDNIDNSKMIVDNSPKTSAAPTFTIDFPINYTLFGKLAPNYSLTITEGAGNFTWYEFLEIGANSTPIELEGTSNENIEKPFNQTMWNSLSNGTATVRFYVNNSLGELGYSDAIIRIDILNPTINLISPTGGFFNSTAPDYTIEISDPNLNITWYTLNTNQTKHIFTSNGTIDGWSYLNDGIVTITFYANDSVSNENSDSVQVTKDVVNPTGSIIINNGDTWTNSTSVTLSLTYDDATSGVLEVRYSNDGSSWTVWEAPGATRAWTLSTGDGSKTVYYEVKDNASLISQFTDTIILDTLAPTGSITINDGDTWANSTGVTLSLTYDDITSGVLEVRYSNDGSTWSDWETPGATRAWTLEGLDGPKTVYYEVKDNASLISQFTDTIILDTLAPTGSIIINDGDTWVNSTSVTLSLTYDDATSGVLEVRYSNDGSTWSDWETPGATRAWTLEGLDGPKTVYYEVKDNASLISQFTDTIILDTTAPTGSIIINGGDTWVNSTSVTLSLTYDDATSGVLEVRYSNDGSSWTTWEAAGATRAWTLEGGDGTQTVYYEVKDNASLISQFTDTIILDTTAPTGSIIINGGDTWTSSTSVTLSLTYDDATSGVLEVRYSNDGSSWTAWEAPGATRAWTLVDSDGTQTVYYEVKDNASLISQFTDTIGLDTTNPIIVINNPINNSYYNSPPPINITVYEPNPSVPDCTYTVTGYSPPNIQLDNNTEVTLNQDIWDALPEGEFQIVFTSFDIFGHRTDLTITLYKDTIAPSITINLPVNNTYWNLAPYLNITAFDPNLDTIWYSVNKVNITLSNNTLQQLNMSIWNTLPDEGDFEVHIYANDTFGHLNYNFILTLYKDVVAPTLIINSPLNNTYHKLAPFINVTVLDLYFDSLWYQVGAQEVELINNTSQQLLISIWDSISEEDAFTIYFFANDSAGNLNDLFKLDLNKDVRDPVITIINPNPDDLFGDIAPNFELLISELNLNQTWYMLYNLTWNSLNYSFNELTGKINQVAWDGFWNGTVTIRFYANDTLNNLGFIEVSVRKNIFAPIITIVSPETNDLFGIEAPNITLYKAGLELNTTWYTIDYGVTNYTFSGSSVVINQTAWNNYGFGDVIITFYINDSLGKIGSDVISLRKDPDPPEISITFVNPENNNSYCAAEPIFKVSAYDPNLHLIWYRVGTTDVFISNNTDIILQSAIWNDLPQGIFTIEIFANDTLGYLNDSITLTFYKDTLAPKLIINQPYDGNCYNTPPPINITVYEPNFASLTYTVIGYTPDTIWLDNNTEVLLLQEIWDILPQGEFIVSIDAHDSFGHHNNTYNLILYKDTIGPILETIIPFNFTCYKSPPNLKISYLDPNLHIIYYKIGTSTIQIFNNTEQLLDSSIWDDLSEGLFTIEFYANDTFGYNSASVNLTLIKDITIPMITINSPENSTYYSAPPSMDITMSDFNPDTIWYIAMGTKVILSGVETFDLSIWNSLGQGEFQINIFANDTAGNLNDSLILTLYKDTVAPLVTINLPLNNTHWNTNPIFNVVVYDPNPVTISYQVIGYSSRNLLNNTDEALDNFIWLPLPEGIFFVDIFAEDSLGNNDSIRLTLYKDTVEPEIDIILPQPNDIYGDISPDFDISISELNLNQTWYMLYNQTWNSLNYLFNEFTGKINQVAWDKFWNGTVTIRFYANDTAGNVKYKDVTVRKNIFDPIITITSPRNNDLFGITAPNFIIYKSGQLLNSTWYTLDNGITNITFTGLSGTIDQTVWDTFGFGTITLKFYINDSFGKIGFDEISIRKDPDMPVIIINSPINQTAFASSPFINITIIEPNLDKVWYRINDNLIDITGNTTQFIDFFIWNSLPQGEFNVELFANDTIGNINYFNILYLSKDTFGPNITIIQPNENQKVGRNAPYFELLILDENGVDSSWYTIGLGETSRPFTGLIGRIEQDLWEQIWDELSQGAIITIRFYAKDTLGNEDFTELNLIVEKPIILPKFLSDPLGLILLSLGLVAMIPSTIKLTKSRYYKSLNNKDKGKLNKLLIAFSFLLSLAFIFYFV